MGPSRLPRRAFCPVIQHAPTYPFVAAFAMKDCNFIISVVLSEYKLEVFYFVIEDLEPQAFSFTIPCE